MSILDNAGEILANGGAMGAVLVSLGAAAMAANEAMSAGGEPMVIREFSFGSYVDTAWAIGTDLKMQFSISFNAIFVKGNLNAQADIKTSRSVTSGFEFKVTFMPRAVMVAEVSGIDTKDFQHEIGSSYGKATENASTAEADASAG